MMESNVEDEKVNKVMMKFMRENSKMVGKQPQDRVTVWSQSTSYPGTLGFHSEIGRIAHARNTTADNKLKSAVSALETIHRKELQYLNFSKKNVELSMVAYSDKMRRISSEKLFDRLKAENEINKSKSLTNMSRLYDDAIKNVSSDIKYNMSLDHVRSASFSQPKASTPINRKASTQERPTFYLTDEFKPSDVESSRNPSESAKRSRKIATISAPYIIHVQDKLPALELQYDTKPSISSENATYITHEQEPFQLKPNTGISSLLEPVGSSVVILPFPEIVEDSHEDQIKEIQTNQDKSVSNPNKTKSAKDVSKKQLNRKPSFHKPKQQTELQQPASPKTHKRKVLKKTPHREFRYSKDLSQFEEISENNKKSNETGNNQGSIIKFVNVSDTTNTKNPTGVRTRSVSVPNSPRIDTNMKTTPLVDCNGNEVVLKSVLRHRKTSDITYLVKKSVQFQLPELEKSHFEVYKQVKCEQSPSTITIIRTD